MFEMKKQLQWSKMKAGLVITLALLILFLAVLFAGNIEQFFYPKFTLRAQFRDVKGLRTGAPVWLFGTEVGSVKKIDVDPIVGAIVTVSLDKSIHGLIKKDSRASILTMGLLGDKYVELTTGSPAADPVKPGEMIQGSPQIEFTDIIETSAKTIEKMDQFLGKMDRLIDSIEMGEGTIGKLIKDPSIYDNVEKVTRELSHAIGDIQTSKGTLKKLIDDPSLYNKMLAATASLEDFSKKLNDSSGTLRKIVEDPTLYEKLVVAASSIETFSKNLTEQSGTLKKLIEDPSLYDRLVAASSSIEAFGKKLNESHGTLQRLLEDPALFENLNKLSQHLSSIAARLDRGEGIAGALIQDNELSGEFKDTLVRFRELSLEMDQLASELKQLAKDIQDHPGKYFKLSLF
jgi:phospholipid/cholesterol/gamma-HCH transport system substrate-binding protein